VIEEPAEKSAPEVAETSGDDITKDDSIQINEVSSSLADENTAVEKAVEQKSEAKEEPDETSKKSLKKSRNSSHQHQSVKKRIFYETRLTKCKTRACNSVYSQKSFPTPNFPRIKKVMKRKPVVMAMAIAKKLEAAIEATSASLGRLKKKNVAKNKENHVEAKREEKLMKNSLRNSIRISNKQNLPLDEKVTKIKVEIPNLKRRASQEILSRACKVRKVK
jgi:hypothetical protein